MFLLVNALARIASLLVDAVISVLAPVDAWLFFAGRAGNHFSILHFFSHSYSILMCLFPFSFSTGPSSKRLKKSELLGDLQRSSGNGTASPDENSGEDE